MDAAEVVAQASKLIDGGRDRDVDSLLVHAVHAGVRPSELFLATVDRGIDIAMVLAREAEGLDREGLDG